MNESASADQSDTASAGAGAVTMCTRNPKLRAAAWCTECRRAYAGRFLGSREDGRAICYECAELGDIRLLSSEQQAVDPALSGGTRFALVRMVLQPHQTFALSYRGSVMPAVRAGFIATMAGLMFWLMWNQLLRAEEWNEWVARVTRIPAGSELLPWLPWLAIPALAAIRLFAGSVALHIGLRMAGAPDGSFADHTRVMALTSIALFLCAIPSRVGTFAAMVVWISGAMAFLRQQYSFSTLRALAALLPAVFVLSVLPPN